MADEPRMHLPVHGIAEAPGSGPYASPSTAVHVLEQHVGLHDRLGHPNVVWISLIRQYGEYVDEHGGEWPPQFRTDTFRPYRFPGRVPEGWESRFLVGLARGLFTATTYQVTAEMCEIAEAMYEQTATEVGHLQAPDVPSECGFLWLDRPFRRHGPDGHVLQVRAITWQPQSARRGGTALPGVRVSFWSQWDIDPAGAEMYREAAEKGGTSQRTLDLAGPLFLGFTIVVPFGGEFGRFTGLPGEPVPLHYAVAVWLLLGTEVAVASRGIVPRQARKRALRSIRQNEVSVVTLRRAAGHPGGEHAYREVDWSCRWLVRGFWRHLEGYGSVGHFHEAQGDGRGQCLGCGARVTWVRPHVKGPDGRPLKASRKVYRLSR